MTRLGSESTESQGTPHKSARKPVFSTPDPVSRRGGSGKKGGHGPQSVTPVKRMQLPSLCIDMDGKHQRRILYFSVEGTCDRITRPSYERLQHTQGLAALQATP